MLFWYVLPYAICLNILRHFCQVTWINRLTFWYSSLKHVVGVYLQHLTRKCLSSHLCQTLMSLCFICLQPLPGNVVLSPGGQQIARASKLQHLFFSSQGLPKSHLGKFLASCHISHHPKCLEWRRRRRSACHSLAPWQYTQPSCSGEIIYGPRLKHPKANVITEIASSPLRLAPPQL